jgi:chromosome segregation ATPase
MGNISNSGQIASFGDLQAIGQAIDGLQSRIKKLEEENKSQKFTIESLEDGKKKLTYLLADMEQRYLASKSEAKVEAESEATLEAEAQFAHKLFVLEQANRELDAENDLIASERDELQNKVAELEIICRQQKNKIEALCMNSLQTPVPEGFRVVVDSLKTKLGLENAQITQ